MLVFFFEETLQEEKKRDVDTARCNRFSFAKVFTQVKGNPAALKKLVLVAVMQCFPEGKNIADPLNLYVRNQVKMTMTQHSNFYSGFGMIMVAGGMLAARFQKILGPRNFTTLCNILTAAGFGLWGTMPKIWAMWLGLVVLMPSMER